MQRQHLVKCDNGETHRLILNDKGQLVLCNHRDKEADKAFEMLTKTKLGTECRNALNAWKGHTAKFFTAERLIAMSKREERKGLCEGGGLCGCKHGETWRHKQNSRLDASYRKDEGWSVTFYGANHLFFRGPLENLKLDLFDDQISPKIRHQLTIIRLAAPWIAQCATHSARVNFGLSGIGGTWFMDIHLALSWYSRVYKPMNGRPLTEDRRFVVDRGVPDSGKLSVLIHDGAAGNAYWRAIE